MEPIITTAILSYLLGLAVSFRADALLKKQAEKRQYTLEKIKNTEQLQVFKDTNAFAGELQHISIEIVKQFKAELNITDKDEPLINLFTDQDFLHGIVQWLVMWDIEEGIKAQQVLELRMIAVLEMSGANPEYIYQIKTTYFAQAAREISRNPVLANWRHQLCLNALHKKVDQLHQLAAEQAGQYSPAQRQQAFDHYRQLTLDSCDILDLAGLPEDDRHLATQKFVLRQFYVPLRLNVEMARNAEISIEQLEQLESRREKQRLYAAGRYSEQITDLKRVSVGKRLTAAQRLVVLGDPGAGKTTLVRWLVTAYLLKMKADPDLAKLPDVATLPDKDWLPVLIRCRELDETGFTGALDDILRQTLLKAQLTTQEADILLAVLREQLANGKALLLLDGLDEITNATMRARFCRQIENIAVAYPLAPIITTSRIVGYREMPFRLGRGFEHATVTELSKEDKDKFTRLLLTTLALFKRKDLYHEAVQVLLNWRSEVEEPIDQDEAIPQLEYVAYEMCRLGVQGLHEDEILELLDNVRKDYPNIRPLKKHSAEEFLHLLERRSILEKFGTVRYNGVPVPRFHFRHLTFQEYLAGLALVEGRFPSHDKSHSLAERIAPLAGQTKLMKFSEFGEEEHAVSENWRGALRLCISCCNDDDVDDAISAIVTPLENEDAAITARSRAILAASCLADEPNVSEEMALEILQKLVGQVQRIDGVSAINVRRGTSLDAVAMELARSEWAKRLQAMLVAEFCHSDAKTRFNYGVLCAIIGGFFVSPKPDFLAQWLDDAIRQLNSNNEAKEIEKALAIMAVAFREKHYKRMLYKPVPALINMLGRTAPSAHAAAGALFWLSENDYASITTGIFSEGETLAQLLKFISQPSFDKEATRFLIMLLGNANYSPAVELLIAKLDDKEVGKRAAEALGKLQDSRAIEPLIAKLDDDDSEVRSEALGALAKICRDEVDQKLLSEYFIISDWDWLDPKKPINEERVAKAVSKLKLTPEEVRQRYEDLAREFNLKLAWQS